MKIFFVPAILFALVGCADMAKTVTDTLPAHELSAEDEWTMANAEYSISLSRATRYAEACTRSITRIRAGCKDVVSQLDLIDQEAERVQNRGYDSLASRDYAEVGDAIEELKASGALLDKALAKGGL